jgi:hypothetical protein
MEDGWSGAAAAVVGASFFGTPQEASHGSFQPPQWAQAGGDVPPAASASTTTA